MLSADKILFLCILLLNVYGCSPEFASPILHNDLTYMAKPVTSDSVPWGTYISGNLTLSHGFNPEDANTFCEVNAYQSYTFPVGSISLGGFGYRGNYRLNPDTLQSFVPVQPYVGKYTYYGGGFRGSFNLTIPTDRIDIRILGVDAVWSKEWGDYLELRKTVQGLPDVLAITEDELLTLAVTQELCIKQRPDTQWAIKWYYGRVYQGQLQNTESFGDASIDFLCVNVHYTYNRLMASFQMSQMENWGTKVGLGYRLH